MRKLIATLALLLLTTACESAKSGAEISALGESLTSTATTATDAPVSTGPAIDYNPRAAMTYTNAVNACVAEARTLCTLTQYQDANQSGLVAYSFGHPGNYWMASTTSTPGTAAMRNEFQITTTVGVTYLQTPTTSTRAFYCCL